MLGDVHRTLSAERLPQAAPEPLRDDGAIPFRVRIGVTGHVDIVESDELIDVVRGQIRMIRDELPFAGDAWRKGDRHPLVRLAVVSQLALGADRLVVREVFEEAGARHEEARLEVILPMHRAAYVREQRFSPEETREFDELVCQASWVHPLEPAEVRVDQSPYQAAGRQLLARCDVLLALWDGEPSRGPGGTAETLLEAAWHGRPCVWIKVPDGSVRDNFTGESLAGEDFYEVVENAAGVRRPVASPPEAPHEDEWLRRERLAADLREPLRESFSRLDRFNHERVGPGFQGHATAELGSDDSHVDRSWLAASFSRAAEVADRMQRRFEWGAYSILFLGASAAVLLAFNVIKVAGDHGVLAVALEFAEPACLLGALGLFRTVRRADYHGRWLSARVLAERVRSAYYVAPTGTDFRRVAALESVYIEASSREWVPRAVEEVWDRRPPARAPTDPHEVDQLRSFIVRWVDGQIRYHRDNARRHGRIDARYTPWVVWLFWVAAIFASVRLLHIGKSLEDATVVLTIGLPAISAALGAWLTVAQHRALRARHESMETDLAEVLHEIRSADAQRLGPASLDAARAISHEGGDWLGTMWFLDVEHP
jgi:hypothetical protein